jgi:DNA-binding NarL/FixJ family response regulator
LFETSNPREALAVALKNKPGLAILELAHADGLNGIDLIKELRNLCPDIRILIFSLQDEKVFAERTIRAGAGGYIMKNETVKQFLVAVETVLKGDVYLSSDMSRKLVSGILGKRSQNSSMPEECLTDRELQILQMIGEGAGTSAIAEKLHISAKTVETHRANIKHKFNLADSAALISFAIKWRHSLENPVGY